MAQVLHGDAGGNKIFTTANKTQAYGLAGNDTLVSEGNIDVILIGGSGNDNVIIKQGEQVTLLWKKIFDEYGMQIIFGQRTFKWDSEFFYKAAIYCVVVGMADKNLPF